MSPWAKRVCSRCKTVIEDGPEPATHGLCNPCIAVSFSELPLVPGVKTVCYFCSDTIQEGKPFSDGKPDTRVCNPCWRREMGTDRAGGT